MKRYRQFVVHVEYDTERDIDGIEYQPWPRDFPVNPPIDPDREVNVNDLAFMLEGDWGWFAEIGVQEKS